MRALFLLSLLAFAGCGSGPEFEPPKPSTTRLFKESDAPYVDRLNEVGFRVLAHTELQSTSVISPVALGHTLAVLLSGSSGKTRDELLSLFDLTESNREAFNSSQRAVINQLAVDRSGTHVGAGVFTVWPVVIDKAFATKMGETFEASVRKLGGATIEGQRLLDVWASERTDGAIDTIHVGLSKEQQLLACSVASLGSSYRYKIGSGPYPIRVYDNASYSAYQFKLSMPEYSVIHFVPTRGSDIDTVLVSLKGESFRKVLDKMKEVVAEVSPPTIRFESTENMADAVALAGAPSLFNAECNLRLVSVEMEHGFSVSAMPHGTVFSLDFTESVLPPPFPFSGEVIPKFSIAMPSVFALVENATGVICFLGIVNDPTAQN